MFLRLPFRTQFQCVHCTVSSFQSRVSLHTIGKMQFNASGACAAPTSDGTAFTGAHAENRTRRQYVSALAHLIWNTSITAVPLRRSSPTSLALNWVGWLATQVMC